MKFMKRKERVERYAGMLARLENKIDNLLHRWADRLRFHSDRLSLQWKYSLFMVFCIIVSCICAVIIVNALK